MSEHESTYVPKTAIERWFDTRLPIIRFGADYLALPTPKNLVVPDYAFLTDTRIKIG